MAATAGAAEHCAPAPTSSLEFNVRDAGASGDGKTDDTAAVQSAIDRVSGTGGTVIIPGGVYVIDAVTGLKLGSHMTLRLDAQAVLKAMPNNKPQFSIIHVTNVSDVVVIGGTLQGDRAEHLGTAGEWGMGLWLQQAERVSIESVTSTDNWGDGFYITGDSKAIHFCSVVADNNRRQGMSIVWADGLDVTDSIFANTLGTPPQAGIDVEPNKGEVVRNVVIRNSTFERNRGVGIAIGSSVGGEISGVVIEGNDIHANDAGGIGIYNTTGSRITRNTLRGNKGDAIWLRNDSRQNIVSENRLSLHDRIRDDGGNVVRGTRFE